ncbi:MAG: WG repeat-containing protein [Bacillota bacterium]
MVIEPNYPEAGDFSEGMAAVRDNSDKMDINHKNFGYIDKTGKMVIKPQFIFAEKFDGGLAHVGDESGTGYIDHAGKRVFWEFVKAGG